MKPPDEGRTTFLTDLILRLLGVWPLTWLCVVKISMPLTKRSSEMRSRSLIRLASMSCGLSREARVRCQGEEERGRTDLLRWR